MAKKLRNTDTTAANKKRSENADEFALSVIEQLNEIEERTGYEFQSLRDRAVALNHLGIKTRRGGEWSKTSVKRILERANDKN